MEQLFTANKVYIIDTRRRTSLSSSGQLSSPFQPVMEIFRRRMYETRYLSTYDTTHAALQQKEMNNWMGPTVEHLWNIAMHVLHNFFHSSKTLGPSSPSTKELFGEIGISSSMLQMSMIQSSYLFSDFNFLIDMSLLK